jgi:hypothetical protein
MVTKEILTILAVIMLLGVCPVRADLVFDSGYNVFDDSYPYYNEVWVINDAHLDVLGGAIGKLELMNYATSNIYNGDIEWLFIQGNTVVNIHAAGDTLEMFAAGNESLAYLYAYDVTYHSPGGLKNDGWIEGIYISNDTPFSFSFYNDVSYSHINIVPEPNTLLFFGLGFLALRRKRCSRK